MSTDPAGGTGRPGSADAAAGMDKAAWRRWLLQARAARAAVPADDEARTDRLLALPELAAASAVAAYLSVGAEPTTERLLSVLVDRHLPVLVPVLRLGGELDWARWTGPRDLSPGPYGLLQPTGPRLGVAAVSSVDVLVCPALAVDGSGTRLGRGGGSYDRALTRARPGALRVALVSDDEVVGHLPAAPHDQPVHVAVTPARVLRLRQVEDES